MVQKKTNGEKLVMGLGIAGTAAASLVGSYFFYGKDGVKHRKHLKSWAIKAKGEVMEKLEKAKEFSEENYHQAIDAVSEKYAKVKDMAPEEIAMFSKDLKKHWKDIKKELSPVPKKKAPASRKATHGKQ